ncbi:MAG: dicarboxylate/amino acid:cation symporter, partial [Saprospiraceae bacterium]|nr:dicarboxylate/amino acid:cation symporter [Saprospiraceae bacterium]
MRKLALHWQIIIGMVLGVAFGAVASWAQWHSFITDWIKPFGAIFLNLLKLIAVPLIISSLIKGVADLKDISKLSTMGLRTLGIYIFTTAIAVSIGLVAVNISQPGHFVSPETRQQLNDTYAGDATAKISAAEEQKNKSPLQPLVDMVPDNVFGAASTNSNMLQIIFFVIFFGVGLILIPAEKSAPVIGFFDGMNEVVMKMVDLIMLAAPYGVFALLAALVVESPSSDIFIALLGYMGTVVAGLAFMIFIFYPTLVRIFTQKNPLFFLKGFAPAQLLAFSTSSSAATLPVSMERVEEHLGVHEDVASFVMPIGA